MTYRVLGLTEDLYRGYGPRSGLEGPYYFNGRILYYDPCQGQYWDPQTDFYIEHDEMTQLHNQLLEKLQ